MDRKDLEDLVNGSMDNSNNDDINNLKNDLNAK